MCVKVLICLLKVKKYCFASADSWVQEQTEVRSQTVLTINKISKGISLVQSIKSKIHLLYILIKFELSALAINWLLLMGANILLEQAVVLVKIQ